MALIGNGSVLFRLPLRHSGSGFVPNARQNWGGNAANNNIAVGWSPMAFAATPVGYTHPLAYNLSVKTNAISSFNRVTGLGTISGTAIRGMPGVATITNVGTIVGDLSGVKYAVAALTGTGDLTGTKNGLANISWSSTDSLGQIRTTSTLTGISDLDSPCSGVGTISGTSYAVGSMSATITNVSTFTGTGNLVTNCDATITNVGTLTGSMIAQLSAAATITNVGTLSASSTTSLGIMVASLTGTGTASLSPYAQGFMAADIVPFTTLSPENLALRVWKYVLEGSYTAEEAVRLMASVAAGKTDIDTSGPSPIVTFRNLQDSATRVTATMTGSKRTAVTLNAT